MTNPTAETFLLCRVRNDGRRVLTLIGFTAPFRLLRQAVFGINSQLVAFAEWPASLISNSASSWELNRSVRVI